MGSALLVNQKISNSIEVNLLYQIASMYVSDIIVYSVVPDIFFHFVFLLSNTQTHRYEAMDNLDQATDFYQQVLNMVPTDVTLLIKMADIATDANDRKQALTYLMEVSETWDDY